MNSELPVQYNYFEPIIDYITLIKHTPGAIDIIQREGEVYLEINIPPELVLDNELLLKFFKSDVTLSFYSNGTKVLKGTLVSTELGMYIIKLKQRIRFSFQIID